MFRSVSLSGCRAMTDLSTLAARIQRLQPVRIWLTTDDLIALRSACSVLRQPHHIRLCGVPVTLMHYDQPSRLVLDTGHAIPWRVVWAPC
jgi:hypothetical protein